MKRKKILVTLFWPLLPLAFINVHLPSVLVFVRGDLTLSTGFILVSLYICGGILVYFTSFHEALFNISPNTSGLVS